MDEKHMWLAHITFERKFTNEYGCICNEIIFTAKSGGILCLTLFDIKPLSEETLGEDFYRAAEETLAGVPGGFPKIYSIMYTVEAAEKCGIKP